MYLLVSSFQTRSGIAKPSLQSLLSTVFRLFGRQNRQQNGQHGQGENVPLDVAVLQSPHHLELHFSAKVVAQIGLGQLAFRPVVEDAARRSPAGTNRSRSRPPLMASWTAWFTTPIASKCAEAPWQKTWWHATVELRLAGVSVCRGERAAALSPRPILR